MTGAGAEAAGGRESRRPAANEPEEKGFGLSLLEGEIGYRLCGEAETLFHEAGLEMQFSFSLNDGRQQVTTKARVLVEEDDWFSAQDCERALRKANYEVAGPVPNVGAAIQLIDDGGIDAALLDIAIRNEKSPIAERLERGGVPFAFLTGYYDGDIPRA